MNFKIYLFVEKLFDFDHLRNVYYHMEPIFQVETLHVLNYVNDNARELKFKHLEFH